MNFKISSRQRETLKSDCIIVIFLIAFGFFINRGIEIKGLYMDDLYLWSCYGEQSLLQYIFPLGSTRFRFIYYLASYLELAFVGNHVTWFVPINILLNGIVAGTVYLIGRKLSQNRGIGFLCGVMYLLSRMSYYQISQVYGLMETMALWTAIVILYCLFQYINEKEPQRPYFIWANLLYVTVCFIHERYMALLPVLLLALIIKKRKNIRLWLLPVGSFLSVQLIRVLTIGTISPAGTGGTDVADTFHVKDAFSYALSQAAYVFGINAGPEHLNGLTWADTPGEIKLLIYAADLVLAVLVTGFLIRIVKDKTKRSNYLCNTLLFITFIAMCIGSSSVTVRVELRWVYVSLTAALLFLAYICGVLTQPKGERQPGRAAWVCPALFLLYLVLMFPAEIFYRSKFPNIYLWPNQLRYNSLAEETYYKYGDRIFGKTIYILKDQYEMSEFTADTFFKVYDKNRRAEGTEVKFIDSIREIGQVTDQMIILREEPGFEAFQDITEFVRELKCEILSGYYRDGWMDESAHIRVMAGADGKIRLDFNYPAILNGGEMIRILVDGQTELTVDLTQNVMSQEIQAEPYQTVDLEFDSNFYIPDAQEQRGEKRLSILMTVVTDEPVE